MSSFATFASGSDLPVPPAARGPRLADGESAMRPIGSGLLAACLCVLWRISLCFAEGYLSPGKITEPTRLYFVHRSPTVYRLQYSASRV